jgi:DNA-binding MarR family transcriptional regulator
MDLFVDDPVSMLIADVYEAAGALRMSGEEISRAEGVTLTQWHVMDAITDSSMTVARAARRMGMSRQAVQKVANGMEKAGLIAYADNPDHKTSPLIALTDRGLEVQQRLWVRAAASHDERFAGLSSEQLEATRETLRSITELTYQVHGGR